MQDALQNLSYAELRLFCDSQLLNRDGNLIPQKFTGTAETLLRHGHLEALRFIVEYVEKIGRAFQYYDKIRIDRVKSSIQMVAEFHNSIQNSIMSDSKLEVVHLRDPADNEPSAEMQDFYELNSIPSEALHVNTPKRVALSHPNGEAYGSGFDLPAVLITKGFERRRMRQDPDRLFLHSGLRFCTFHPLASTAFDETFVYRQSRSGALAKRSLINVARKPLRRVERGYILPFPHYYKNYFHALSEMVYGLRHLARCDVEVPIFYAQDHFGLIPFFCDLMNIDQSRLVDVASAVDIEIDCTMLPSAPPFYWSADVYEFFRNLALKIPKIASTTPEKKIYISRSKSSRRISNESEVENLLARRGYMVLHSEDIGIGDQIRIFSHASCIIAPHGAGLANMVFAPSGVVVIEIFNEDYIVPDFFHRSQFVTDKYRAIIAHGGTVNLAELREVC